MLKNNFANFHTKNLIVCEAKIATTNNRSPFIPPGGSLSLCLPRGRLPLVVDRDVAIEEIPGRLLRERNLWWSCVGFRTLKIRTGNDVSGF